MPRDRVTTSFQAARERRPSNHSSKTSKAMKRFFMRSATSKDQSSRSWRSASLSAVFTCSRSATTP